MRGEMVCMEGDPAREVYLLTSGVVKVMKCVADGQTVIFGLGLPGDVIGPSNHSTECGYSTTIEALRPTQALAWRLHDFKSIVERCPAMSQNILRIQHGNLLEIEERFCEMATKTVSQRLARQLVRLHGKLGRSTDGLTEISLSREELAQMTGTTLFSTSRLLAEWETRGFVRSRREAVTICDPESLNALSE